MLWCGGGGQLGLVWPPLPLCWVLLQQACRRRSGVRADVCQCTCCEAPWLWRVLHGCVRVHDGMWAHRKPQLHELWAPFFGVCDLGRAFLVCDCCTPALGRRGRLDTARCGRMAGWMSGVYAQPALCLLSCACGVLLLGARGRCLTCRGCACCAQAMCTPYAGSGRVKAAHNKSAGNVSFSQLLGCTPTI